MTQKPVIFISYSHKDASSDAPNEQGGTWLDYIQSFFVPALRGGIFELWVDENIAIGSEWRSEMHKKLDACDVYIVLISRYSLASPYVADQIATVVQRKRMKDNVVVFPIVLTPVPREALRQLDSFLIRPRDGIPLSMMSRSQRDSTMVELADEISHLAANIKEVGRRAAASTDSTYHLQIDLVHLPDTPYERLVGRDDELMRLDEAWVDPKINIISLIAEGGAGKSALVNEWLNRLQTENYRGAETVLGWAFDNQGSKERASSAEEFLNWTVDKLGIVETTTSASAKGEAIAETMAKRRSLLVLDGVEPLQHGLDGQQGELKDAGLRALLRRFASTPPAARHGLIVLTSRLAVKDIARWRHDAAPVIYVENLSKDAGAALLRDNGVWGTDKQLEDASHDFGGHPLSLGLLASFLNETQTGDVRRRDHIRVFFADPENPRHDHAKRVMESYEKEWLAGQPVLLAIMHMVGLFDRQASGDCLYALRAKPAIAGLTEQIVGIDKVEWKRAVARLRAARLLAPSDPAASDALDAHPLVREWFGERLRQANESAWKAAHGRLFEYLGEATKEGQTPTLENLAPLYQAIGHGCRAGRHQEALDKIYMDRICRRRPDGAIEFYASRALGALGSNLAAISWFFDKPYASPSVALTLAAQSWVLSDAAFYLRAEGRFAEALPAMHAALRLDEDAGDWCNGSIAAANLSEAELLVGEIVAAATMAEHAVALADSGGDEFQTMSRRATYADALHAAGRGEAAAWAARVFAEAEQRQKKLQPEYPLLYSLRGYQYCDLLLAEGHYPAARDRASQTLQWARQHGGSLLTIALDTLTLGRAHLGLALGALNADQLSAAMRDFARTARARLDDALSGLRAAGTRHHLPRGLLARAAFRRSIGNWESAARDLDDVEEIAEPGPMRLYICDMTLERARLAFSLVEAFAPLNGLLEKDNPPRPLVPGAEVSANLQSEAEKQLKIAADYIETCGYHRRDEELAELQAVLRGERKFADLPPRV
jgi:tetratricopeptide (TPR) repeat protein